MKKTFTLPAPASPGHPIGELHYYQWLKANKVQDVHGIQTKLEYLREQGFVQGTHRLGEHQLRVLRAAEEVYFLREIKPTLGATNEPK